MIIKVGCCDFAVRGGRKAYHNKFRLVEVQSTFYKLPMVKTAERWRQEAPKDFEFTLKCWQAITHPPTSPTWRKAGLKVEKEKFDRYGFLRPTDENFDAWKSTREIYKALRAKICLIQCPPRFNCTPENINNMRTFLQEIDRQAVQIAWEPRGDWKHHGKEVKSLCMELNLIHVVDILRYDPIVTGKTVYTRLHGLNPREYDYKYEYTDTDLHHLAEKVKNLESQGVEEVYVLFNNLSMFDDGLRFMRYIENGRFPSLTGAVGLESVKIVAMKTRYPATKSVLLKKLGWRLVEVEEGKQIRLTELLRDIPPKAYKDVEEVLREIRL